MHALCHIPFQTDLIYSDFVAFSTRKFSLLKIKKKKITELQKTFKSANQLKWIIHGLQQAPVPIVYMLPDRFQSLKWTQACVKFVFIKYFKFFNSKWYSRSKFHKTLIVAIISSLRSRARCTIIQFVTQIFGEELIFTLCILVHRLLVYLIQLEFVLQS